jgi:hypothetical protein
MTLVGNRKLIVAMTAILSASTLVGMRLIADGVYATVVVAAVGGYLTANVAQKGVTNAS